ncbi:MAG: class II aldolase/adducin family protein [Dehalococcoidia bacterium]|nr:class II aldolase/adducin family protein [Dehalococcoidia bacterium]
MNTEPVKEQVAKVARKMGELGLVSGTSGNVSARLPDGLMAITPMGKSYEAMSVEDIVVVDGDLDPMEGELMPSSESLMHVAIYAAREDVGGVVHTHAVYSSAAAAAGMAIPPIVDEMVVTLGGEVRVSEYAPPASEEVAERVCAALGNRDAALIRNHGAVAVGADPETALAASVLTERAAQIFVLSSVIGRPATLPDEVVASEAAIFEMRRAARREKMR